MSNMQIAEKIIRQLGGHRFAVMTGAAKYVAIERGLAFQLPATITRDRINRMHITLSSADLYDLKAYRIRGARAEVVAEADGVHVENLHGTFTELTGLDTRL